MPLSVLSATDDFFDVVDIYDTADTMHFEGIISFNMGGMGLGVASV